MPTAAWQSTVPMEDDIVGPLWYKLKKKLRPHQTDLDKLLCTKPIAIICYVSLWCALRHSWQLFVVREECPLKQCRRTCKFVGKLERDAHMLSFFPSISTQGCPLTFHLFTPKSDQCQIYPAASPELLHHTVWRTWLLIAYSDERWLLPVCYTVPHSYIFY